MISLKLLNKGLRGVLKPSEFITLFVIESVLGLDNKPKKLYNEMIADLTGLSVSQVKRCTKSLEEKGFISKQIKQISKTKRETFYMLNLNKNESKNDKVQLTGEPSIQLKTTKNNLKQLYNNFKQLNPTQNNNNNINNNYINDNVIFENEVNSNIGLDYTQIEKELSKDDDIKKKLDESFKFYTESLDITYE